MYKYLFIKYLKQRGSLICQNVVFFIDFFPPEMLKKVRNIESFILKMKVVMSETSNVLQRQMIFGVKSGGCDS